MKFCVVGSDTVHNEDYDGPVFTTPGTEVFMCVVAQSREEFIYQLKKISHVLGSLPKLQGVFVALVARVGRDIAMDIAFHTSNRPNGGHVAPVELAVLAYHRDEFNTFKETATTCKSMEDWERQKNFMRFQRFSGRDEMDTTPVEGWSHFQNFIKAVVESYSDTTPRPFFSTAKAQDCARHSIYQWLPSDIVLRLNQAVEQTMEDYTEGYPRGLGKTHLLFSQPPYYDDGLFRYEFYAPL
ncbi:uncharacterized protein B0H18DRAFT_688382 [Fomitopsis serialis]|uniref:uncharacterized protein n=1 Tax=Fomitopsis serialis TaxID=139415 RepID=UPI0020084398|nr:uncharacterized protein B0H18DRAFT_688382 [Neoantrodia serialis]KAH9917712.1 hypothetical protein B0H18DRAFT_688382 [Neoantrodia serialis]